MKIVVTISMLALLIYNSVGYYIVFKIQHQKAAEEFNNYLSTSQFTDSDLIVFKIPLKDYSTKSGKDFNRVEGDFEHDGKFYEIVKQKIENDTIYNYCLNNEKVEALYAQLYKHVNTHLVDGKTNKTNKSDNGAGNLLKEYLPKSSCDVKLSFGNLLEIESNIYHGSNYPSQFISISTPPPELV